MATSSLKQKIFCLLSHVCLVLVFLNQAQAEPFFVTFSPKLTTATLQLPTFPSISWLAPYQFKQVIPIIVGLMLIVLILFVLDRQLKKRVLHKFLMADKTTEVLSDSFKIPTEIIFIASLLLFSGMVAAYSSVLASYQLHQNKYFLKYLGLSLLILTLVVGYLLGSLKRNRQVEALINNLQIQIKNKEIAQEKLMQGEERLHRQNTSLGHLAAMQLRYWQNPAEIFKEITEVSSETLDVERVSVWLFSDDGKQLECMDLYLKSQKLHVVTKPLRAQELPQYFSQLAQHRVIAANDVMDHPATIEFMNDYAQEHHIGAILDGTIWLNNHIIGVICHEHVGGVREWTLDEKNFAGSIADLARLTIETDRRRKAEQALLKHSEELEQTVEARTLSLQESERTFRYVVEHAPIPILIINKDAKMTEFNPEAEIATGYSREQALGKNFIEFLVTKESRKKAFQMSLNTLKGEDFRGVELCLRRADGIKVEFECSASLAGFDVSTGARQIVAIGRDISQQKALEQSLITAREAAESADRIKSMFVASMSHELRTPLNSIIGFLGVVLQGMSGELNLKQKDQLGRAYHSAKHLLSLISDVIDISKIEAGFLSVHAENFELTPLLNEVEHAVHHIVDEKQLAFSIDCAPKLMLETDRKRLYQVVLNVVSNAVKYTEHGAVKVKANVKNKRLVISTEDTGIGLDETGLANLFKPFERAESRLRIKTLGTGLGLYLTRKILTQLLGGTIDVKSQPEVGSIFTMTIPIIMPKLIKQAEPSVLEGNTL